MFHYVCRHMLSFCVLSLPMSYSSQLYVNFKLFSNIYNLGRVGKCIEEKFLWNKRKIAWMEKFVTSFTYIQDIIEVTTYTHFIWTLSFEHVEQKFSRLQLNFYSCLVFYFWLESILSINFSTFLHFSSERMEKVSIVTFSITHTLFSHWTRTAVRNWNVIKLSMTLLSWRRAENFPIFRLS